jgi:O-acetyl-ADP-ribose deacetylase (regulator of RNase III)
MATIKLHKGDITKLSVDAIVNAANTSLLGGGGVDGAIHRAAGRELLKECRALNGCKTGEAKITKGYKLSASYVIHTVGPVWCGGKNSESDFLRNAYYKSLLLAEKNGIKTIAFPNISTGVYGFPKELAAQIAVSTVQEFCEKHTDAFTEITFVCFDDDNLQIYTTLLHKSGSA